MPFDDVDIKKEKNDEASEEKLNPEGQEEEGQEEISEEEAKARRDKRRDEWGTQCDRWLIRCQQKNKAIILHMHSETDLSALSGVEAIPKRIDQFFVQFEIEGREIWVNKRNIVAVESSPAE